MVTFIPRQKEVKKRKKLSQFLKAYSSETPSAIQLKFGMWGTDSGGNLQRKYPPVL